MRLPERSGDVLKLASRAEDWNFKDSFLLLQTTSHPQLTVKKAIVSDPEPRQRSQIPFVRARDAILFTSFYTKPIFS